MRKQKGHRQRLRGKLNAHARRFFNKLNQQERTRWRVEQKRDTRDET